MLANTLVGMPRFRRQVELPQSLDHRLASRVTGYSGRETAYQNRLHRSRSNRQPLDGANSAQPEPPRTIRC
eukprot:1120072-Amphidinium_carterae.1